MFIQKSDKEREKTITCVKVSHDLIVIRTTNMQQF